MNENQDVLENTTIEDLKENLRESRSECVSLSNAVYDLLSELRIDKKSLEVMANGYSPDYPGAIDLREDEAWINPHCKIQLSRVVAQKLLATLKNLRTFDRR
jgi:hypothetical protein